MRSRSANAANPFAAVTRAAAVAGMLAALLAACSGGSNASAPAAQSTPSSSPTDPTSSSPPASGVGAEDWITFHRDNARTGVAPGISRPSALSVAWRAQLDGAVYGQPLLLGTTVIAATENDSVYGLARSDGHVLWHASLGKPMPRSDLPCGDIDPLGITSTAAYDPATGSLFVLAETQGRQHLLAALDPATGTVRWKRYAEPTAGTAADAQQRAALTVAFGRVYIAYGGLAGDCGNYVGSVVAVPTSGSGDQLSYGVPTARQAGIWTPGGLVVHGNTLLAAVGNGTETGPYDDSDSVLALTPDLRRADFFAPTTWLEDNKDDLDLGSMSPAVVNGYVLIAGKRGTAYLMRPDDLGHVGGQVVETPVCAAYGAAAVDGTHAYLPCSGGIRAVNVDAQGVSTLWSADSSTAYDPPAVGGGAVWSMNADDGVLYALDQNAGKVIAQVDVGSSPHFASPTLAPGRAYVGTMSGVVAVAASS
jgi:polyvinyl alcohol dehydrogenase (cytochrome)